MSFRPLVFNFLSIPNSNNLSKELLNRKSLTERITYNFETKVHTFFQNFHLCWNFVSAVLQKKKTLTENVLVRQPQTFLKNQNSIFFVFVENFFVTKYAKFSIVSKWSFSVSIWDGLVHLCLSKRWNVREFPNLKRNLHTFQCNEIKHRKLLFYFESLRSIHSDRFEFTQKYKKFTAFTFSQQLVLTKMFKKQNVLSICKSGSLIGCCSSSIS